VNAFEELLAANLMRLQDHLSTHLRLLSPYLLFLLWVALVGAIEGRDWRRGRLYAGYYRLIFLAAAFVFVLGFAATTLWLAVPTWLPVRTLTSVLILLAFGLGWCTMAGRPVLR
jgi:hypothetical protein